MSIIRTKKGKWFIERVEGFTQVSDKNCPACSKSLRHATIFIRAEEEDRIDPDKSVDIILNRNEALMIDDAEIFLEEATGSESPTENISDDETQTRIVGFWCTDCKRLHFWE